MYNHSSSKTAYQQLVAQQSHKTNFYEDEYNTMVSKMDKKAVSSKNRKMLDPYGVLLKLSVLADEKYHSGDLGYAYADSLHTATPQTLKKKSKVSIHELLKWKRYEDKRHELFMSMTRKMELYDIKRIRQLWAKRKQRKRGVLHGEIVDTEDSSARGSPDQREGDFRMSNTSEGGSSKSSMPEGDFVRSSTLEEDFQIGGVRKPWGDFWKDENFSMGINTEDDFMVSSAGLRYPLDDKPKSISKQNVQKNRLKNGKVSACRQFTNGWSRQGEASSFQHSVEGSFPYRQKVFLGGLPYGITPAKLLWELKQKGYKVLNQPKIYKGSSQQVCLSTIAEAMKMLQERKIMICGRMVDVRPYKAPAELKRDRQRDRNNRSIFLVGLPSSVTEQIVKTEIEKLRMKVTDGSLIKAGSISRVILASALQKQQLVAKGTIDIKGALVRVWPYVSKS